jgi:hypothetical protein
VAKADGMRAGSHALKRRRVIVSRSVSPQPADGEEAEHVATTTTADSAGAGAAQQHVNSATAAAQQHINSAILGAPQQLSS